MTSERTELRGFIVEHYSLEEFQTLCYDLGVRYDALVGEGIEVKARELILHMWRRGQLADLLDILQKNRPIPFAEAEFSKDPAVLEEAIFNTKSEQSQSRYNLSNRTIQIVIILIISAIAFVATILVVPEFRQFFGLEPSSSSTALTTTEDAQKIKVTPSERLTEMTLLICQTGFAEGRLFWMIECPEASEAVECWVSGGDEYTRVENGSKVPLCDL